MNPSGPKEVQPQHCPEVLLSFSGMDGSGKSTQIENLCNQLTQAGLPFVRLEFWDNVVAFPRWRAGFSHKFLKSDGGVGAPGKPVNRNDKNNRAWYLILARSALFLFDAFNLRRVVAKTRAKGARIIVFDRYIFDQLATLPLESALARAYARLIMKLVPRPDVAYLLDAEPEIARERKPEKVRRWLTQTWPEIKKKLAAARPGSSSKTRAASHNTPPSAGPGSQRRNPGPDSLLQLVEDVDRYGARLSLGRKSKSAILSDP